MDQSTGQPGVSGSVDAAAFEREHLRLAAWIRRTFQDRTGGRADAVEELCQRTWLGVWEAVSTGRYDPTRAAMTTFVYAVATNIWRQWAKQQRRAGAIVADAPDGEDARTPDTGDALAEAELIDAVRACVHGRVDAGLDAAEREVLRLVASGETDRGLADRLGVAASTAHARRKAAIEKLRGYLSRKFGGEPERGGPRGE